MIAETYLTLTRTPFCVKTILIFSILNSVSTTQLTKLERKASAIKGVHNVKIAEILYYRKTRSTSYFSLYTMVEAKKILQGLTP